MSQATAMPILDVDGLSIRFQNGQGETEAVKNLSFALGRGERLAIVGESGSGKSATAMALLNLLPGDARVTGQIRYAGENLANGARNLLAQVRGRRIAMIFQDPAAALDPVFSIGFQLDEAIRLYEPDMPRKQRRLRAVELLRQVGIGEPEKRLKHYPHQFSGGQLQRVMIALALSGRPEILIADEPTTALDVTVQQDILDLLYRLNIETGMALLLITHDMGVVADIAQRVIVMRHGAIVEAAPAMVLFTKPAHDYTRQLLAAVPERHMAQAERKADNTAGTSVVELRDLRVAYGGGFRRRTEIVKGVSFDICAGEFLGLIGESGSGKTTIGRSLMGLVKPLSGTIRFTEKFIHSQKRDPAHLRRHIGTIFQNPAGSLNPKLTIGQSIAEPLQTHDDLSGRDIKLRVEELIEQVGLPAAWSSRHPFELSGGQRQRIAIARALALKPALLIADEPTSALDVSVQAEILKLLHDLQQDYNFACLFISHDLAVVRNLCQSVIVLRNGLIVEAGRVSDVLGAPENTYTQRLIASAPVADPAIQAERRIMRLSQNV